MLLMLLMFTSIPTRTRVWRTRVYQWRCVTDVTDVTDVHKYTDPYTRAIELGVGTAEFPQSCRLFKVSFILSTISHSSQC